MGAQDLCRRLVGPIAVPGGLCITVQMGDVQAQEYRLGSRAASIVGMTQQLLDRGGLDEEAATRLRAIRELALELAQESERSGQDRHD
jgi:hypothetical protein